MQVHSYFQSYFLTHSEVIVNVSFVYSRKKEPFIFKPFFKLLNLNLHASCTYCFIVLMHIFLNSPLKLNRSNCSGIPLSQFFFFFPLHFQHFYIHGCKQYLNLFYYRIQLNLTFWKGWMNPAISFICQMTCAIFQRVLVHYNPTYFFPEQVVHKKIHMGITLLIFIHY